MSWFPWKSKDQQLLDSIGGDSTVSSSHVPEKSGESAPGGLKLAVDVVETHREVVDPPRQERWRLPEVRESDIPEGIAKLPFFRPVLMKLMRMLSDPDPNLAEVTRLIQSDAGFSTEMLYLANCLLYGFASSISSVSQAVMVLGFERTKTLAVAVGMRTALAGTKNAVLMKRCWSHSLATALVAEELATAFAVPKDCAYTGGLIHDIGRLGLLPAYSAEYEEILHRVYPSLDELLNQERDHFRVHHADAGFWLTRAWGFPEELREIAARHHETDCGALDVVSLVSLSCQLASALGFGCAFYERMPEPDEVLQMLPPAVRQRGYPAVEPLRKKIESQVNASH